MALLIHCLISSSLRCSGQSRDEWDFFPMSAKYVQLLTGYSRSVRNIKLETATLYRFRHRWYERASSLLVSWPDGCIWTSDFEKRWHVYTSGRAKYAALWKTSIIHWLVSLMCRSSTSEKSYLSLPWWSFFSLQIVSLCARQIMIENLSKRFHIRPLIDV